MAKFVKATYVETGRPVLINMDLITNIERDSGCTKLYNLAHNPAYHFAVRESGDQLLRCCDDEVTP